jgi:ligand-binding sensor domain-containing protein
MQIDADGNLWMALFGAERPLVLKTKDGRWFSYKMQDGSTLLAELDIDHDGQIWVKAIGKGIIVYNNAGTIEDPTDDKYYTLTNQNTNLPSNNINFIKTDLDGNVWVGTDKGPLVFECAGQAIKGECSGTKKKTVLGGIAEYVLNDVNINCIEVDGANRKWIGTSSGLYVLNANGDEEIERFTSDNSPLFENNITSLAYNDMSGEMLIGTLKGMLSYKTETTKGEIKNSSDAYAYPNPVPPDYDGLIAFKGLARDANVKITDIEGNLIFETTAQGGQATWDGRDFKGNRVGSGVYIVFSTATENFDKVDAVTLKVFFIK